MLYASIDEGKRALEALQPTTGTLTVNDQKMIGKLRAVTRRVDNLFPQLPRWPMFAPWIGTRLEPITPYKTNAGMNTLALSMFLLELTGTVSVNGLDLSGAATYPDPAYPPFKLLRLTDWAMSWYSACGASSQSFAPPQASMSGVWGFNSDYANAWMPVDVLVAPFITTTTQTSFKVVDVDGSDLNFITPRISIGNLLKVESEYMEVTLTNPADQTVTVKRGVNGSSAAAHASGLTVYRWEVEAPVKEAVARQAAMQYSRIGAFETVQVSSLGSEVRFPSDWLNEVLATLQGYDL